MPEQVRLDAAENYQEYINRLVETVRNSGLQGMTAQETDDLDEAIELGFISEDILRVESHAS